MKTATNKSIVPRYAMGGELVPPDDPPIVITNQHRRDWNSYVDWLQKKGLQGSPTLDKGTTAVDTLKQYMKESPNTSLKPELIDPIQKSFSQMRDGSIQQFKTGKAQLINEQGAPYKVNELTPEVLSGFLKDLSTVDGIPGSRTTKHKFPDEYLRQVEQVDGKTTKDQTTKLGFVTGYGMGGDTGKDGGQGNDMTGLVSLIPQVLNGIMSVANMPKSGDYSDQPILSRTAIHNMAANAYAMGGDTDMGLDDDTIDQLQQLADEKGISLEELVQILQGQGNDMGQDEGEDQDQDEGVTGNTYDSLFNNDAGGYGYGGSIHIKKANKGKFTASAKKAGMGVQAYAKHVLANPNASGTLKKRANFARNASRWQHAMGGNVNDIPINVEGNEVVETPDGKLSKMLGPSHEQGGIDMDVPEGTKIFSDRLEVDGKSMQQRKIKREKALNRIEKMLKKNPTDALLKNTYDRTKDNFDSEEQQDMALQQVANKIYKVPSPDDEEQHGYGERIGTHRYAYGGYEDDTDQEPTISTPYNLGTLNPPDQLPNNGPLITGLDTSQGANYKTTGQSGSSAGLSTNTNSLSHLTPGDWTGLAGNAFNAIAPIINTRNAARATKPAINRYQGYGQRALDSNQTAQTFAANLAGETKIDNMTAVNASKGRNRNNASDVNTLRALDSITDLNSGRVEAGANNSYASQMMNLLGQRSTLLNDQDRMEMSGQTNADARDAANTDNHYTNMGANLTNFGNNVQGIGKSLNVAKSNQVNSNLLSQLSKYGLGYDDDGNLIKVR